MKKIDKIYLVLLCIVIVALNLFIGSNHQEPKTFLQVAIILVGLIYIIIKKSKKEKNIIIKSKIDILVTLLVIATFVPLGIKSYYSLNDTINYFLQYICIYTIYILVRNLLKTQKEINIVIDVTLISSIMIVIFGLDKLYYNVFNKFLELIGTIKTLSSGMVSTIGYSNPLVAYMGVLSMFALGRSLCQEKALKNWHVVYIQIAMIGFIYGNSRAMMIIYLLFFICYLILLKDNKKRMLSIFAIGGNFIIAYLFQKLCNNLVTSNLTLWILFICDLAFVYFLNLIISKIIELSDIKVNKKKFLIVILIIGLLLFTYFIIVKNIEKPVQADKENKRIEILGLKNNQSYNITINLDYDMKNSTSAILSLYSYSSKKEETLQKKITLENGNQTIEFNIKTSDDFDRIRVYVENKDYKTSIVTVNNIFVNDKKYIANYKYLPNDVMRIFKTVNIRTASLYERIDFCKDSLNLSKENLLFGAGGRTFQNHIKSYQTYKHSYNNESHSYVVDMLLNYGLVGLSIYLLILIITIYNVLKTIKKYKNSNDINEIKKYIMYISVVAGIFMIMIHSMVDYDFEYLVIITMFYMFIGIINKDDKIIKSTKTNILDYLVIIVLIITWGVCTSRCYADYLVSKENYKEAYNYCKYSDEIKYEIIRNAYVDKDEDTLEKYLLLYIKDEKYKNQFVMYDRLNYLIEKKLAKKDYDGAIKNLEVYYKYVTEDSNISSVYEIEMKTKKSILEKLIKILEKDTQTLENTQILELYNKFNQDIIKNI